MKILFVNLSDQPIPASDYVIRADTSISLSIASRMKEKGHEVYFLCSNDSNVSLKMIKSSKPSLGSLITINEFSNLSESKRTELLLTFYFDLYLLLINTLKNHSFDLIHFHCNAPLLELVALSQSKTPCLFTLHSITNNIEIENRVIRLFNQRKQNYFVSISNYQRKAFPAISFIDTVYNGISTEEATFDEIGTQDLIFAGRLKKIKGIEEAIKVAQHTHHKLIFTGKISGTPEDRHFFDQTIKPYLQDKNQVEYIESINKKLIYEFYRNGKATLFPIQWEEPFGLVMIESMAAGTPVIAYARGSVPEIIQDGQTGFIINPANNDIRGDWIIKKTGFEGLCEAIERIYSMPDQEYKTMRRVCRTHVEKNFTVEKMVDEYEEVYKKILREK